VAALPQTLQLPSIPLFLLQRNLQNLQQLSPPLLATAGHDRALPATAGHWQPMSAAASQCWETPANVRNLAGNAGQWWALLPSVPLHNEIAVIAA